MKFRRFLLACLLVLVPAFNAHADKAVYDRKTLDLVSRTDVTIGRTPAQIWPLILETESWKKGLVLRRVAGEPGKVGQVFAGVTAEDESTHYLYVEDLELEPNRLRTVRLMAASDGSTIGYASWMLEDVKGGTRVSYHVYSTMPLPDDETIESMSAADLAQYRAQYQIDHHNRFEQELQVLRAITIEKNP